METRAFASQNDAQGELGVENIAPDTGQPLDKARGVRFGAGFFVYGVLWIVGLMIVASVLLPQRLVDIGVSNPTATMGTINAITAIVSLASNLIFGNLSDRTRSRFGRRTPWILAGGVIGGVSLYLVGVLSSVGALTLAYCVSMVGLNMMLAPAVAVLSDRVPQRLRGTMSAFYGAGLTAGAPIGTLIGAKFITNAVPGFVLGGVLMAISAIVALIVWPRERSAQHLPAASHSLKDILVSFRPPRNAPDFYYAFAGRLFMLVSYQMIMAYQLYIVQNYLGQDTKTSGETIATMAIITLVVGLFGSVIAGPISDKIRMRKLPVILSSILFAVGIALPWIMPTTMGMFLFAGVAGFGYGVYTSVDQALNVDVLPSQEEAGKDLGILNLSTTIGQTVGPLITSAVVTATGGFGFAFPIAIAMALIGAICIIKIKSVK